jgi:hypothetical protein
MTATPTPARGLVLRGHAWYYDWVVRLMNIGYARYYVDALLYVAHVQSGAPPSWTSVAAPGAWH